MSPKYATRWYKLDNPYWIIWVVPTALRRKTSDFGSLSFLYQRVPPLKSIKISTMGRALLHYVLENQEEDPLVKESFFVPKSLHAIY